MKFNSYRLEAYRENKIVSDIIGAATFGYLTFGANVLDDILENYSGNCNDLFVKKILWSLILETKAS
jgi:hypothetical protein